MDAATWKEKHQAYRRLPTGARRSELLLGESKEVQCWGVEVRRAANSGVPRSFAKAGSSFSHSAKRTGSLVLDFARRSASSVPLRSPSSALATARLPRAHMESGSATLASSK